MMTGSKPFPECASCALRDEPMVPSAHPAGAQVLIVGEAPGIQELKAGRPFVGPSGHELEAALGLHGPAARHAVTNAVLCRPPKNELVKAIAKGKAAGLADPVVACNRRLQEEIRSYDRIVLLGSTALKAAHLGHSGIFDARGFPETRPKETGGERYYFPTLHPAHVIRNTRWRHVFRSDVQKAFRYFDRELHWTPPVYCVPTVGDLEALHARAVEVGRLALDVETYGEQALEPLRASLGLLGMGVHRDRIVVLPVYAREAGVRLIARGDPRWLAVRALLADERVTLQGWNAGSYDRMVLEHEFDLDLRGRWRDGLLVHHACESELPNSLAYSASVYTDVHSWKEERGGLDVETDAEWRQYNANDVAVTLEVMPQVEADAGLRDQLEVVAFDHAMQEFCVDLHKTGLYLDRAAQERHRVRLQGEEQAARFELVERALDVGMPRDFNPGSTSQLAGLLFDKLKLPYDPEWETDSGGRGTDMDVIRELLLHPSVSDRQRELLLLVHEYRRPRKWRATFVDAAVPLDDGRVHYDFNAAATVSGRFGSRAQQIPKKMRDMFAAAPGHVLVGADMDQIELRFVVALAGIAKYREVFAAKGDPHALTCALLYGENWKAQETKDEKLRNFAKRFSYGNLYGATAQTVWRVLRATEDEHGHFPYLKLKQAMIAEKQKAWLGGIPELPVWWAAVRAERRTVGFLRDPVLGRRRDFLDGDPHGTESVNYPVQAGARVLVARAARRLRDEFGFVHRFDGLGTGLVYDGHDQLVCECRAESTERVKAAFVASMNQEWRGILFSSKAKVANHWGAL
jgi:uracil-DNA glycosylase family 4